jgi:hypothetical protein
MAPNDSHTSLLHRKKTKREVKKDLLVADGGRRSLEANKATARKHKTLPIFSLYG